MEQTILSFWKKVTVTDGCWLWTGSTNGSGYGEIRSKEIGGKRYAHRFSWELEFGPIPKGGEVCHSCDQPSCVNPEHLFLGSHHDNMLDAKAKNRMPAGERNGQAKLTIDQVREIRSTTGLTAESIARKFNVSRSLISLILRGDRWAEA